MTKKPPAWDYNTGQPVRRTVKRTTSPSTTQTRIRTKPATHENKTAEQVFCVNGNEGHVWMEEFYDNLPSRVRDHLKKSGFNICPACVAMETLSHEAHPSDTDFFATVERFEQMLRKNMKLTKRASEPWGRWWNYLAQKRR